MKPYFEEDGITIYHGDCREILPQLELEAMNCCVTSPPYWGLRDYGSAEQIGLEKSPAAYVEEITLVFHEVNRLLRPDGTLWLNLGDTYFGGNKGNSGPIRPGDKQSSNIGSWDTRRRDGGTLSPSRSVKIEGLKIKDLVGIPWLTAFSLRSDGWYLRSEIIWNKLNPMPESVEDRPTKAHEQLFLFAKSADYFCAMKAIREKSVTGDIRRPYGSEGAWAMDGRSAEQRPYGEVRGKKWREGDAILRDDTGEFRNKRDVWTIASKPFPDAHFATFPTELVKPCILAGCPEHGTVVDPFMGSGTVLEVARQNNCHAIGIELEERFCEMAAPRFAQKMLALSPDPRDR